MLTFRQTHAEEELRPCLKESARAHVSAVGCRQGGGRGEGRVRVVLADQAPPRSP